MSEFVRQHVSGNGILVHIYKVTSWLSWQFFPSSRSGYQKITMITESFYHIPLALLCLLPSMGLILILNFPPYHLQPPTRVLIGM